MNDLVRNITKQLQSVYPADESRALAWWILEETTGLSRTQLLSGDKVTTFSRDMQAIIDRLLQKEPIQYIFGHTLWCGLDLKLTPATLIPRPETAELVAEISDFKLQISNCKVLDVGTGSGCIALALKQAHPDWQVTGLDISREAIEVARENARRNHLDVDFQLADIFDEQIFNSQFSIFNSCDVVVSNPPYIAESERALMDRNVLDYEPHTALFVPDNDPLRFYRRIAELRLGEWLFFEINPRYAEDMLTMMQELGYQDITLHYDTYNQARILYGRIAR